MHLDPLWSCSQARVAPAFDIRCGSGRNLLPGWNDPFSATVPRRPGLGASLFNAKRICSNDETHGTGGRSLHLRSWIASDNARPVHAKRVASLGNAVVGALIQFPVVGDFIVASPGPDRTVTRVLERRTWLSRNVAGGAATAEQVLAANVDVVFVVQGLDEGPNPRRLERTLASVHAGGAEPVIILTKPDRAEDLAAALAEARAAAHAVEVEVASGLTGEGVAAIAARLRSVRTGVLVGPSGAGKSTLTNALLGREAQRTAPVRASDDRGVHTTSGRELFPLPAIETRCFAAGVTAHGGPKLPPAGRKVTCANEAT